MKSFGIKYQLRIATLIPVLLVALLFAVFYNGQFRRDLDQHISRLGEAFIHQLIPAAQLSMLREDHRMLQGLIDASTINPEVRSLAFYNAKGQLIAYRGGKHSLYEFLNPPAIISNEIESRQISADTINFIAPITLPKFNFYTAESLVAPGNPIALQPDDILGWLSIDIDNKSMVIQQYRMYIITIFITLLGLIASLFIHYLISKKIYAPISRLRRSMKQILNNDYTTKINTGSPGELGIIEQGIAHLQQHYLTTLNEFNQNIEVATADLQQGLELLEEKNIELSLEKKKIEEKGRLKSELFTNMSHEIRTPMNGIIGFTNVLLESKLDPLQLDYVKTIKSSSQDLLAIINDILDYSKMDAGKLHLDCIPLDIRACIDEVLALIAPMASKKGIDLIPVTAINVPKTMLGDPLRLKQMLNNLVSNAVKFTEQGYVQVRTDIIQETDKDYSISIAIIDTGIGMTSEDQAALFNAFNQADTSITRRYGGTGLGLVICKNLAEHMQGRITIYSEIHKGSTFKLHIKLAKLVAYEIEKHQIHRFANLNVICYDDNPLHLETICNGLGFWGINCLRVESFSNLEEAFEKHPDYHLAFVNVNQGCEQQVAQVLRKYAIPSVLVSKWLIHDYESLGAQGFLFKPPNIQKLHETIESLLKKAELTKANKQGLDLLRLQLSKLRPTLLIAEDNPVNRMLLDSMLGDSAELETVIDGEQAVEICNTKQFQAILLDFQMPKLNGLEAAHIIHQHSMLNKNTPIILISANDWDINKNQLHKAGIKLCLRKPIYEEFLLRELLNLINKTKITPINWQLCVQKVSGNKELAREFLDKFVEELKKNRVEFLELMHNEDIQGIEHAAHRLHGACCFCGVPDLQHQVANLENIARHAQYIEELQNAFAELLRCIDEVLQEYENSYETMAERA